MRGATFFPGNVVKPSGLGHRGGGTGVVVKALKDGSVYVLWDGTTTPKKQHASTLTYVAARSNPSTSFEFDVSFVIEFEDYYQGCGAGRFDEAISGIGHSAAEALEDAFEQLSQADALTTAQEEAIKAECIRDMGKAKFNKEHRLQEGEWVYCCLKVSR